MPLNTDLFIRLINHRVTDKISRKEDFLTEIFCWILEQDHTLTGSFLQWVGFETSEQSTIHSIQTQVQVGQHGRVDAQIQSGEKCLLIECKVDAPYDADQIERYLRYANAVNAKVIVIIPALQAIHISAPTHDSFSGIFTWEDIYTWLKQNHSELNPILQPHIESLLALMRHYRLEPIDRSIANWEDQSIELNRQYIRAIGESLNAFVPKLSAILKKHPSPPEWYIGDKARLRPRQGNGMYYSGKGPSPRVVLAHNLQLISKFDYPWFGLELGMGFGSAHHSPKVFIQFWTGVPGDVLYLLSLIGVKQRSDDGIIDHQHFQNHMIGCMEYIANILSQQFPHFEDMQTFRTQGYVGIGVCNTSDLLADQTEVHLLKPEVIQLYETTLKAFLNWGGWQEKWYHSSEYR
jgi:hypothetical protein